MKYLKIKKDFIAIDIAWRDYLTVFLVPKILSIFCMPFLGTSIPSLWILPAPSNEDNPGHWFRPIKRILIPKHGNYFLVESSTLKAFESGLQLKESGILLKIIMQNPSSTDKDRNSVPRIQNPRLGIQNSRLELPYKMYSEESI